VSETLPAKSSRSDIYQRVTDKLIEFLEDGASLCERLWVSGSPGLPLRTTNEPYRGINTVLLWVASIEHGFEHRHWMTYKSAQKMGAQVRKGEKGQLVVYVDEMVKPVEDKVTGDLVDMPIWFWKGYTVFNASQIDGLPAAFYEKPVLKLMDKPERIISAQQFIAHAGANLVEGGAHAFYRPSDDTIHMPEIEKFRDVESYYSVALHELTHWSGAKNRLDRAITGDKRSPEYAREELVAEISSAFLCASLEITPEVREDHAGYLQSWLGVLRADKRAVFTAAAHAQKAADYLHGLQPKPPTDPA
jgi:antirestriction protein ArdC